MTAIELKKQLIERISEINDEGFLRAIKTILDSKTKSPILKLTNEQKAEILASQKQVEEGLFTDQADLDKAVERWAIDK
jgi:hypothetical protein